MSSCFIWHDKFREEERFVTEQIAGTTASSSNGTTCEFGSCEFSAEPAAHYDRVTGAWQYLIGDDLHVGYFENHECDLPQATRALTRLLADSAQLEPGDEVLDVGCGTGNPAIYLALERGCRVTGISTSGVGIARAKARATERRAEHQATFEIADGTANGFPSNSFDCIWVMESSHLIPRKDLLINECVRVLRPGGTIVLCDLTLRRPIPTRPGGSLWHDLALLEKVYGKTDLYSMDAYVREFEMHALRPQGRDISEEVLPTFSHWKQNAERYAPRVSEIFGADQWNLFARSCEIMPRLFQNRQLGYCLVTGKKEGQPEKVVESQIEACSVDSPKGPVRRIPFFNES